jgi:hypothetical protein
MQKAGASATINGKGNTVDISANDTTIHADGEIIRCSQPGLRATITGNNNAVLADNGDIHLSGTNNTVTGNRGVIHASPNSTVYVDAPGSTINGSNCTIILGPKVKGSEIHNYFRTDGNFVQEVWQLKVKVHGDWNVGGPIGLGTATYEGANNGAYWAGVHGSSYGALNAPPLAFPHFDATPSGGGSSGGTGSPSGWTSSNGYNYSMVYFPQPLVPGELPKPDIEVHFPGEPGYIGDYAAPRSLLMPQSAAIVEEAAPTPKSITSKMSYAELLHDRSADDMAFERFMNNVTTPEAAEGKKEPTSEQAVEASLKDLAEGPRSVEGESVAKGVESAPAAAAASVSVDLAALEQLLQIDTSQH